MDTSEKIAIAAGRKQADLVLKNCRIIDVFSHTILEADIAIHEGLILGIGVIGVYKGEREIELQGKYVAPGLIDSHVHIESSLCVPGEFAHLVIPRGTTTVVADPHEIANVLGERGIRFILNSSQGLPLTVWLMLPSCVPATSFEHSGAVLSAKDLEPLTSCPGVLGLGEVMDFNAVIRGDKGVLDKLEVAMSRGMPIDGHSPLLRGQGLNAYVAGGISTDHECSIPEEMEERLRLGMRILIREGSSARDIKSLIPAITPENSRRCAFCTDDKQPADILNEGHIDFNIRKAVNLGLDPVTAIQMATINAAETFGLKGTGAIAIGYQADLITFEDLKDFRVQSVFKGGELVAENGKPLFEVPSPDLSNVTDTVRIGPLTRDNFQLPLKSTKAHVISLKKESLITPKMVREVEVDSKGFFTHGQGIVKIAVVERHNGSGRISLGLVENYGLSGGAIATTIAHDSHNLIIAGDCDEDMFRAAEELTRVGGGLTICIKGEILATLPLPVAGLMSNRSGEEVALEMGKINRLAREKLGIPEGIEPFITLSFLALPVIPELKLTDMGLFDVVQSKFIDISV